MTGTSRIGLVLCVGLVAGGAAEETAVDEIAVLIKKKCVDPIGFTLENRLKLFHFEEHVVLATKDCANAAAEAKLAGIRLPFKGFDKLNPEA